MHYAVVIPVKSEEAAHKLLEFMVGAGLGAMIEERGDGARCPECQHKSTSSVTAVGMPGECVVKTCRQ
jgi:hypothetical protein